MVITSISASGAVEMSDLCDVFSIIKTDVKMSLNNTFRTQNPKGSASMLGNGYQMQFDGHDGTCETPKPWNSTSSNCPTDV
jgi:hypothetical protein